MKYKKLSNHFWQVEFKGKTIVGTWDKVNEEVRIYA